MASEGANSAGTGADDATIGAVAWSGPSNITVSDDTYATAVLASGQDSHYLLGTNFGFVSVAGTVNGITVEVECNDGGTGAIDQTVRLYSGGAFVGDNKALGTSIPDADAYIRYGGAADDWNASLTAANVLSSGFGAGFQAVYLGGVAANVSVDHMRITISYVTVNPATIPRMDLHSPHLAQRRLDVQAYRVGGLAWMGGVELIGVLPGGLLQFRETRTGIII